MSGGLHQTSRERYDAKPEVKERRRAYSAKWAKANRDRMAAAQARYDAKPENKERAAQRRATLDGKARETVNSARRAAGRNRTVSDLTLNQWIAARAFYGDACAYCGQPATGMDHVIPLSRGGANSANNVVPCCLRCNGQKSALDVEAFIARYPHVAAYFAVGP